MELKEALARIYKEMHGKLGFQNHPKIHLKNEIQRQIGSYSDYQDKMIKNYGASGRLGPNHMRNFAELDEAYGFVVSSMSDDGVQTESNNPSNTRSR